MNKTKLPLPDDNRLKQQLLKDQVYVIAGEFKSFSRKDLKDWLIANGAEIRDRVTMDTNYLIVGPGAKDQVNYKKARKFDVSTKSEHGFKKHTFKWVNQIKPKLLDYDKAIAFMQRLLKKTNEVDVCRYSPSNIEININGNGNDPLARIEPETLKRMQDNGDVGYNCYIGFKRRSIFPFKGSACYKQQKEKKLAPDYANKKRDALLNGADPMRVLGLK